MNLPWENGISQMNCGIAPQMSKCSEKCVPILVVVEEMYVLKKLWPTGPIGQFENFSKFPWQPARVNCSLAHPESNWLMICKFKETEAKVKERVRSRTNLSCGTKNICFFKICKFTVCVRTADIVPHRPDVVVKMQDSPLCCAALVLHGGMQRNKVYI